MWNTFERSAGFFFFYSLFISLSLFPLYFIFALHSPALYSALSSVNWAILEQISRSNRLIPRYILFFFCIPSLAKCTDEDSMVVSPLCVCVYHVHYQSSACMCGVYATLCLWMRATQPAQNMFSIRHYNIGEYSRYWLHFSALVFFFVCFVLYFGCCSCSFLSFRTLDFGTTIFAQRSSFIDSIKCNRPQIERICHAHADEGAVLAKAAIYMDRGGVWVSRLTFFA